MDSLTTYWDEIEEENSKKGMAGSVIFHMLLLIIFFLPAFTSVFPPPGPQGVLVSFGNPTQESNEKASAAKSTTELEYKNEEVSEPLPPVKTVTEVKETPAEPVKKPITAPTPVKQVKAKYERTVDNTEEEAAVVLKEEKEKERKKLADQKKQEEEKKKADAEAEKVLQQERLAQAAEAEKKRKVAEEEAAKQAAAEAERKRLEEIALKKAEAERKKQEAYNQTKSELGGLFSGDDENGSGAGQQGDPSGKSKSDILEGLSTGSGKIGGGLSGRGILFEPKIKENSQKTGIVVVKVCVDKSGKVISSKYTQRGSTTTESELVQVAEENAAKYVFSPGELVEQCGTITIDFRLQ